MEKKQLFKLLFKVHHLNNDEKTLLKEEASKQGIAINENDPFSYHKALLELLKPKKA